MKPMRHFRIVIEPLSEEDGGGFLATVPELPGCMSDGDTAVEAVTNVQDAICVWLAEAERLNRTAPTPQTRQRAYA